MKKIIFIFVIFFLAASPAFALEPLVPCHTETNPAPCTPCDFFNLADRVMDLFKDIALSVLVVALLAGGVIWTTSAGSPDKITQGRKIIVGSVIGIFLAFGGWLIIDTIVNTLGGGRGDLIKWAWNEVGTCEEPITTLPSGLAPIPTPTGFNTIDNQNAANALIQSGVLFLPHGECTGASGKAGADTNLNELIQGQSLTVCQSGCSKNVVLACQQKSGFTLNGDLLRDLNLLRNAQLNNPFNIESLTTGDHSPTSDHYQGKAADIIPVSKTQENYKAIREQLRILPNANQTATRCEKSGGAEVKDCNSAETTHIHFSVK